MQTSIHKHSKKIQKNFFNFLRYNGCLKEWAECVKNRDTREFRQHGQEMFPHDWIADAFSWDESPSGWHFWAEIASKWYTYLRKET